MVCYTAAVLQNEHLLLSGKRDFLMEHPWNRISRALLQYKGESSLRAGVRDRLQGTSLARGCLPSGSSRAVPGPGSAFVRAPGHASVGLRASTKPRRLPVQAAIPKQRQDLAEPRHPHPHGYPHPSPGRYCQKVQRSAWPHAAALASPGAEPFALPRVHPSSRGEGMPWELEVSPAERLFSLPFVS